MRLLLDQGLPRSTVKKLSAQGHDAAHVGDIGLGSAKDAEILSAARADGRIVVTLDSDFHALMALSGQRLPSVIRIRIEGLRAEAIAELLEHVLGDCTDEIATGALVSVELHRVRVRTLPILPG